MPPTEPPATKRVPTSSLRETAMVACVLYLLTVSIPALALYGPARDPNYTVGPGPDTPVIFGVPCQLS
jgi:hypothetical protein